MDLQLKPTFRLYFYLVLYIQEHFLLDSKSKNHSNTNKLRNDLGINHDMFIVPATKDITQVTKGRGKSGLVTLWKNCLTRYVSKIDTSNFRIQATKFSIPGSHFVLVNAYFPCDPRVDNFDEGEILSILAEIQTIVDESNCSNVI